MLPISRKWQKIFWRKEFLIKIELAFSCNLQVVDDFGSNQFFIECLKHKENHENSLWRKKFFEKNLWLFSWNLQNIDVICLLYSFNLHAFGMCDVLYFWMSSWKKHLQNQRKFFVKKNFHRKNHKVYCFFLEFASF